MARYKLVTDEDGATTGVVVNDGTHPELAEGASIPNDSGNRHWVEYEAWVDEGNTADAADGVDWMQRMRDERDSLLSQTDWTQLSDVLQDSSGGSLTQEQIDNYAQYRQELRDMPQDNPDISSKAEYEALTWPTNPGA